MPVALGRTKIGRRQRPEAAATEQAPPEPDKELDSYLAALAPEQDVETTGSGRRFGSSQVYQLRLPLMANEKLKQIAAQQGTSPAALARDWVMHHLEAHPDPQQPAAPAWPQDQPPETPEPYGQQPSAPQPPQHFGQQPSAPQPPEHFGQQQAEPPQQFGQQPSPAQWGKHSPPPPHDQRYGPQQGQLPVDPYAAQDQRYGSQHGEETDSEITIPRGQGYYA